MLEFPLIVMLTLSEMLNNLVNEIIIWLPLVIAAIIVIIIGVLVGIVAGKAANALINRLGIEKNFDKSRIGKSFRAAGLDLSNFVGAIIEAFVIILAIVLAIQILNVQGTIGTYLTLVADYLPRLLGGVLVIVIGTVLVDFLATLVGSTMRPMFPENKSDIADMLRNLLFIGLVAVILNIAFDLMLFTANGLVYSLILGFVIIGAGIALTDGLIGSITDDHKEFTEVAGYAKFALYSIFLVIGAGAIFATFTGVTNIITAISWGFAIAFAIVLIPLVYRLTRKIATAEAE